VPRTEKEEAEISEAQIAVHWKEEKLIHPPPKFIAQANMADPTIFERFKEENFPECFKEYAELLSWDKKWHATLDASNPPFWRWFVGGKLNACYNCVDRHLEEYKNKVAIIWVPEPEDELHRVITYQELYTRVNEFALVLQEFAGLKRGDR
jgi:acetyl-CoA synthetase